MKKMFKAINGQLSLRIDTFIINNDGFFVEYDGWHFEAKSEKTLINKILKYIFSGGND